MHGVHEHMNIRVQETVKFILEQDKFLIALVTVLVTNYTVVFIFLVVSCPLILPTQIDTVNLNINFTNFLHKVLYWRILKRIRQLNEEQGE